MKECLSVWLYDEFVYVLPTYEGSIRTNTVTSFKCIELEIRLLKTEVHFANLTRLELTSWLNLMTKFDAVIGGHHAHRKIPEIRAKASSQTHS